MKISQSLAHSLLLSILIAFPSVAVPTVEIETEYYPVRGKTAREIRKSLNRNSPIRQNGKNFDGLTNWYVSWRFWWQRSANSCAITRVETDLDIKYTLPQLVNQDNLSRSLQSKWSNYITALTKHEETHKDIAVETAIAVEEAISTMEPAINCQQLEVNANKLGHQILDEYREKQQEYDRHTRHGATEGAIFP